MKGVRRNYLIIAIIALVAIMCVTLTLVSVSRQAAQATDGFVKEGEVTIGHISDTHYYSYRLCYTQGDPVPNGGDDYFYNYVMQKCTKLWMEGELVFDAGIRNLALNIADAYASGKGYPQYLLLSGDVAQDGELLGHVDVSNKLRRLQNYVRTITGNDGFQIFVVMGNHDIYNPESWRFDNATGQKTLYLYNTRIDAVRIYAGLGYPNMTETEAADFYAGFTAQDLPAGYEYVRSDLSDDFAYRWQFLKPNADDTVRTYKFGTGAGEYAADEVTMANFLAEDIVKTIDNSDLFAVSGMAYCYAKLGSGIDLGLGEMTTLASRLDNKFSVIALDVIQSNAKEGHVLGGQLHFSTWDWLDLDENKSFLVPDDETLLVATCHHSVVPHWDMEEEITTGFILYNWREVADYLADYGVRYVYTGHQHANDAVSYISNGGNQIIDMESAAHVSTGSQIKWTTVEYGTLNESGKSYYAENAILDAYQNVVVAANETYNSDMTLGLGNVHLYDDVFANDKFGYLVANQMNTTGTGPYVNHNDKTIANYSNYAQHRVYENAVDNYLAYFLRPEVTNMLGGILDGMEAIKVGPVKIQPSEYSADVVQLANNLVSEVNKKILADYTYSGDDPKYKGENMKLFAYAKELVERLVNMTLAEDATVLDTFLDMYRRHSQGDNVDTVADLPVKYQEALKTVQSGEFVRKLFNILLDKETGLMKIIIGLCETDLDLSANLSPKMKSLLEDVIPVLGIEGFEISKFNLGKLVKAAAPLLADTLSNLGMQIDLENMTIPEIIDDIVAKYVTDDFITSLGEYVYDILVGLGTDGDRVDIVTNNHDAVLKVYKGEGYTYIAKERAEIVTVENGKLPSMLTNNFGSDPTSTRNFTYFTDRRIKKGAIQYAEAKEGTDLTGTLSLSGLSVTKKDATTELYATTKALIDLGIWCQAGYTEVSRHTIKLTGLKENTTYLYRVGEPDKGYWSDVHYFTTAAKDGSFDVLISSDIQSSTETKYKKYDTIYHDILKQQFSSGLDFMINPGDVVDNSRNLTQFKWFVNSSADIYADYAMVVAAGNHDSKYFDINKAKNVSYYADPRRTGADAPIKNEYNYLWSHYNYDLTSAQNQKTGFYYSFDYSDVHFTVLNTNDIETIKNGDKSVSQLGEKQYEWLVEDLKKTDKKYKVVVMHKSLYSEGSHSYDNDVVGMRAQLTPVFAEQKVNLVLAGHDHTYNETYYLDAEGKKVNTDANGKNIIGSEGTLYVTMGTIGEKFYNYVDNDNVPTNSGEYLHKKEGRLSDPTFGKLVYDGENLYYYGYQYIRTMSEDGLTVTGGEIKDITKGSGLSTVMTIVVCAAAGVAVVASGIAVFVVIAKSKGPKKAKA